MKIGEVVSRLLLIAGTHRVMLEPNFVNVAISLAVMDGLGRQLHDDFNIFRHATPFLTKAALRYFTFYLSRDFLTLYIIILEIFYI